MPIPEANSPWPLPGWAPAYQRYAENDAWLTGDTEALTRLYGGGQGTHTRQGAAGGVRSLGALARRMFWGRARSDGGAAPTRLHVPAGADIATLSADLQYSDPPEFILQDGAAGKAQAGSQAPQERLDRLFNSDASRATLHAQGELKAALGATVCVPRWDTTLEDHVWWDYAGPDTAFPVFRQGRLVEVTLWSESVDGDVVLRHLEHHEAGSVEHALFRGTRDNLGRRVPLQDSPMTAHLAALVDSESRMATHVDRLAAVYVKNSPTSEWRKNSLLRDTGRSDFAQLYPLFDSLDETFSSWMRDLKLGAGRLIVPEQYLTNLGKGKGASFDTLQEAFVGLAIPGEATDTSITVQQFAVRVEEHERTARGIWLEILRKAGYSPTAWGDIMSSRTGGQVTATETNARDASSERTRAKKNLYDQQEFSRLAAVTLEMDGILFRGKGGGRFEPPTVAFPDISRTDPRTEAETISYLDAAGAISRFMKVQRANPEWKPDQVEEEVEKILQDAAPDPDAPTTMPAPAGLFDGAEE